MWPCVDSTISGVDFTLFLSSESLVSVNLHYRGSGEQRNDSLPEAIANIRIPSSMRSSFELLMKLYPEKVRCLHQRQNWQLLRDGMCFKSPSVVPQGIGYPLSTIEATGEDDDDFVREDIPVQTGLGVWNSNGDFHYFANDDQRLSNTYRTHKDYPRNPWIDAMSATTKTHVRRIMESWRSIVDDRNRLGMYVPLFVVAPAETTAPHLSRARYFGQFYHHVQICTAPQPAGAQHAPTAAVVRQQQQPPGYQSSWSAQKRRRPDDHR